MGFFESPNEALPGPDGVFWLLDGPEAADHGTAALPLRQLSDIVEVEIGQKHLKILNYQ